MQLIQKRQKPKRRLFDFSFEKEKEFLTASLYMQLSAGVGVVDAIESIATETRSPTLKSRLSQIILDIENGVPLSEAMENASLMDEKYLSLIKLGETNGKLSESLQAVSTQQEKEQKFKSAVVAAMIYPIIVFSITIIVGGVVVVAVLPKLTNVFSQLKIDLPLSTRIILWIGNFIKVWGYIAVPGAVAAIIATVYFLFIYKKTNFIGQEILLAFPGTRDLIHQVEIAKFSYTMGNLLESGIGIAFSVETLSKSGYVKRYQDFYKYLYSVIVRGSSFQKAFAGYKDLYRIFPSSITQVVIAGEKSGYLAEAFLKINKSYEDKIENASKNIATALEPILLVIVWLGVLFVALAVVTPIYSLVGNLDRAKTGSSKPAPKVEISTEMAPMVPNTVPSDEIIVQEPDKQNEIPGDTQIQEEQTETEEVVTSAVETAVVETAEQASNDTKYVSISDQTIGFLNVREYPSTTSTVITRIYPSDKVLFVNELNNWYQIQTDSGLTGYVYKEYAQITQ